MIFTSEAFLIFLPIVLCVLHTLPQPWRNRFQLAASCYFYGSWDWRFLGLIFLTSAVDYNVALQVEASDDPVRRRRWLLVCLLSNLTVLGFFKYFNFFIDSAAVLLEAVGLQANLPTLQVLLPVGISFYTFQSIAYVMDVYRRDMKACRSFFDFAIFVSYFPQLVAGPIERAAHLLPQVINPAPLTAARIQAGVLLIVLGFAKKVLIADTLAPEVDRFFSDPGAMSSGELLRGAYLFTFQIYGDFAGYSDIARGVSELLGVRLMVNFNQPYLSRSITEFWRRWHISLSTWLRDYLYIPLGGNRNGSWRTYRNLMLTMLIGGLWHGANWTFVVWGGLHGGMLAVERMLGIGKETPRGAVPTAMDRLRDLGGMVLTFHFAALCWIFFRAPNVANAFAYVGGIAELTNLADVGWQPLWVFLALLLIDVPQYLAGRHTIFLRVPWWIRSPAYAAIGFTVLGKILYGGQDLPFIYFQF